MATLGQVIRQLEDERNRMRSKLKRVDDAIAALRGLGSFRQESRNGSKAARPRRRLSAGARRRIALAQKARWAKHRQQAAKS